MNVNSGTLKQPVMTEGGHASWDGRHYTCLLDDCNAKVLTITDLNLHIERRHRPMPKWLGNPSPEDIEAAKELLGVDSDMPLDITATYVAATRRAANLVSAQLWSEKALRDVER